MPTKTTKKRKRAGSVVQESARVRELKAENRKLKNILIDVQWIQPMYNGTDSCSGCGQQRHLGCLEDCSLAAVTGDRGGPPVEKR